MKANVARTLGERIDRLKHLYVLRAPGSVLCMEVLLVFKAAFAACPEQMGQQFAEWVSRVAYGEVAICPNCKGYMPHEMHICEACIKAEDEPTKE